jgi:MFS family permease
MLTIDFCSACFGAVMITISAGSVVDISKPEYLAFTLSMWSIAPMNAPSIGGIIGGFIFQYLGWRWSNWIILIAGGVCILMMTTCRETYQPIILTRKAARMRKELDDPRWWCQYDQKRSMWELLKINLSRPFILAATEPILWFLNAWISLVYGVLYLCFVAYPIVFTQHRGWAPGIGGLAFVGMGAGTLIAIVAEPLIRRVIDSQPRDPETGTVPPEATALIMGVGAILIPFGQLIFSWTCLPSSIHWIVPLLADVPFGIGNALCFIYGAKYIAGAYGIYSASALAGNAVIRSVFGGTLPLAGPKMYNSLTPQWAGTLLGLLEVIMIPIPFVFWRYGAKIRAKSRVIRQLRDEQSRMDAKRARAAEKRVAAMAAGSKKTEETEDGGREQVLEVKGEKA